MSKYTTSTTNFRSAECLLKALHEAGYTAAYYTAEAKHLQGYHGDTRPEMAEIIIPRNRVGGLGASSNDIGFKRNEDGVYVAIISEYDQGIFTPKVFSEVKQNYGEAIAKKTYAARGLRWTHTEIKADGHRKMHFAAAS